MNTFNNAMLPARATSLRAGTQLHPEVLHRDMQLKSATQQQFNRYSTAWYIHFTI